MEHVLAISRVFVALMAMAAWMFRLSESAIRYQVGLCLLLAYFIVSVVLLLGIEVGGIPGRKFAVWAQVNDVGWPALLCLTAESSNSAFFLLFLFAIIAAAFRWGFLETLTTALVSTGLLLLEAMLLGHLAPVLPPWLLSPIAPSRLILRCGFLIMAGALLGFLAETEQELRAEIALTNHLLSLSRVGNRYSATLQDVLTEFAGVFRSSSVYDLVVQSSTGRAFKWEIASLANPVIRGREIGPPETEHDFMPGYPHTFFMRRAGKSGSYWVAALDEEGRQLGPSQTKELAMPLPNADSVLVVSHEIGRDWAGRLVLPNARLEPGLTHKLHFAQNVVRQVAPALYSVFLFRAFRSRAEATERARVARELHDTTIQSLIGIEMQMDVLRRGTDDRTATEINRIQALLRNEVLNLRELMQSMRPVDISPHQFLDFIAGLVERFSRDTGISVRFISDLQEVALPAATCRELARVVQEGLVNIRKHSRAQSAVVRFGAQNGTWKLAINDDGQGFPFAGRYTLAELDNCRRGPAVIKERVRAFGGDMVIESTPGHGSRLEITIPRKGHEAYA